LSFILSPTHGSTGQQILSLLYHFAVRKNRPGYVRKREYCQPVRIPQEIGNLFPPDVLNGGTIMGANFYMIASMRHDLAIKRIRIRMVRICATILAAFDIWGIVTLLRHLSL